MNKKTARLVYVATPYAGLGCSESVRRIYAVKVAREECKKVINAGYIPVSPILTWDGLFDENKEREKVITAGLELMCCCSYVYFSKHPNAKHSTGMKEEKRYANEIGLCELDFDANGCCEAVLGL